MCVFDPWRILHMAYSRGKFEGTLGLARIYVCVCKGAGEAIEDALKGYIEGHTLHLRKRCI